MRVVPPGHHLGSIETLRLPDDSNRVLWIVQVIQKHTDYIIPVFSALIGLSRILIPDTQKTQESSQTLLLSDRLQEKDTQSSTYLPSASLAFAYCRWIFGEETCGSSSPTLALKTKKLKVELHRKGEKRLVFDKNCWRVSPVLAANVNRRSFVVILALFIELSSFRKLL